MSPVPAPSDAEIIAASLTRPQAFEGVFERHFEAIHGFLARRIGADGADDLAANVFTIAFERRATFRERDDARPWLYGIAANLLRNEWRARGRAAEMLPRLAEQVRGGASAPDGDGAEAVALASALAALDANQRDVLLLHVWEGLRYAEIAAALQIPVGTVRSRLARARGRLRRELTRPIQRQSEVTG